MKINWPVKKLGEIVTFEYGESLPEKNRKMGSIPVFGSNGLIGLHNIKLIKGPGIIIGRKGSIGKVTWADKGFWPIDTTYYIKLKNNQNLKFVYFLLNRLGLDNLNKASGVPGLNRNDAYRIKILLPPTLKQQKIVEKMDEIRKALELNDLQISKTEELYDSILNKYLSPNNKNWPVKTLSEIAEITSSKRVFKKEYVTSGVPFYRTKEIVELSEDIPISLSLFISEERYNNIKGKFGIPQKGDILISAVGTIGISWLIPNNRKFYFKDGNLLWIRNIKYMNPFYLKVTLDYYFKSILRLSAGGAYNALTIAKLKKFSISNPPQQIQQKIVEKLEAIQEYKKKLLKQKELLKELFDSVLDKSMKGEMD